MPLPIKIEKLILNKTIESSRIGYERGWNPKKVLHTICAFANDYENLGGGNIIIGIEELIEEKKVAYLYPESPRSSKQRLCPVVTGRIRLRHPIYNPPDCPRHALLRARGNLR